MAAPTLYLSSDGSAPVLTGTAGDLVNLLNKCLVAGYGAKAAAGWTRPFTDGLTPVKQAVFQQGAGNSFCLDVDDRGATSVLTSASGREAAIRGYEAMTAVATGTNPFPTTAQVAAATANWRKSATADATVRGWFVIADDRSFILGVLDGDVAASYKVYYFGDLYSLKTGDGFRTIITARTVVNSSALTGSLFAATTGQTLNSTLAGLYIARIAAGTGTSANEGMVVVGAAPEVAASFANSLDGGLYLSRFLVSDSGATTLLRGWLRGIYYILQPIGLNDGDTFTGTGDFAGRSFTVVKGFQGVTTPALAIETTAWDTSS